MSVAPGTRLGPYEILSPLGAGGMGEVYLAEDTRLRRKIALKLLPARVADDRKRLLRFRQEALAASGLNHPNIITVYEIGDAAGTHFIAMELVEGQTLRQHARRLPLGLNKILEIAVQIASALDAAHKAKIVHRDIKPENVMVRADGYVKVLDFGLAKLTEGDEKLSGSSLEDASTRALIKTGPGQIVGTTLYMSPEQARGQEVDARTDVWSLGVVLYELVAGRAPFEGESASDVIAAALKTEPAPLVRFNPDVPHELERIVTKALRKDREERYQTSKDLLLDLKSLKEELDFSARLERTGSAEPQVRGRSTQDVKAADTAASVGRGDTPPSSGARSFSGGLKQYRRAAGLAFAAVLFAAGLIYFLSRRDDTKPPAEADGDSISSIAVLPFENVSGDPNADYLADGLTESIINSLTRLRRLRVIPRSTVFRFKGVDAREVARQLNVRAVLTGRVAQRGDNLDIQTELVDTAADAQLWGEKYNRKLADVFVVQEEIAREITEKLRLRLTGEEQQRVAKHYTDNLEAYQLYLQGRYNSEQRTEKGLRQAIEYFNRAVAKDPNYALAYAGLADSYGPLAYYGHAYPKDTQPLSQAAARKAVELDDSLVEAHATLAATLFFQTKDWAAAEREYLRAIELNPNYPDPHSFRAFVLVATGRGEEGAVEGAKRGLALDPLSPLKNNALTQVLYYMRRYDEAVAHARSAVEMNPNGFQLHAELGVALAQKGMYQEAVAELQKARELSNNTPFMSALLGHIYAVSGNRAGAVKILNELKKLSEQRYVSAYHIALIHAGLGEKEQALDWLDKAYEERNEPMVYIKVDPRLDGLHDEPRFRDLLRRLNLSEG